MEILFNNVMETLVLQKLDGMLDKLDCCKCDKCRMDIAAYALNHLPSKYVASHKGELLSKLDALSMQHDTDITAMLVMAAGVVKKNPRHSIAKE